MDAWRWGQPSEACAAACCFSFPGEGGLLFPAALAMALLMVKGSYQIPFGQRKRLLRSTAVFFGMAFLLGGVLPVLRLGLTLPVILSGIAGTALIYAALRLKEKWKYETENLTEVTLFWNGRQKKLFALRDTGNRLVDPYFGKPVAVVEYQAVKELLIRKRRSCGFLIRRWESRAVACRGSVWTVFISRDGEEKKIDRPIVAVCKETLSAKGRYQMILPSALTDD
ncbi:MAG: sigma-E processing peptidase SpoIIGA [Lachnospiraceae bacterium]